MEHRILQVLSTTAAQAEAITPDTRVSAAATLMNERHLSALLVVAGERLVGIVTKRDLVERVLVAGRDPEATTVSEVMTGDPVIVAPDYTIAQALEIVDRHRCRHLPVVDRGKLCGLVMLRDLNRWMVEDQGHTIDDLHDYITR